MEHPDNRIEIVIHVNMLKEGWDVTNLYTIVPLRAADAPILVEQSIGRGLRLPYGGKRTGFADVDKLTVIAHENFEAVIARAKDPNSVLSKFQYAELDEADIKKEPSKVVAAQTMLDLQEEKELAKDVTSEDVQAKKKAAETYCENASEYTRANGGKPWRYVLLAHDKVDRASSFDYLVAVG